MSLNPTLRAGLEAPAIRQFVALRVELSGGYVINLIDGRGTVAFDIGNGIQQFDGEDPVFGALASASSLTEQVATDSPRFTFALMPTTADAVGTLSNPAHQGCPVYVWWGMVDEMTGAPIGTPTMLWSGRWDFAKTNLSAESMVVEVETVSAFDRLYVAEEGARLNPTFHRSLFPGETGLDWMTAAQGDLHWGTDAPAPAIVKHGGGSAQAGYTSPGQGRAW